jgi:hypothetical protein
MSVPAMNNPKSILKSGRGLFIATTINNNNHPQMSIRIATLTTADFNFIGMDIHRNISAYKHHLHLRTVLSDIPICTPQFANRSNNRNAHTRTMALRVGAYTLV